MPSVAILFRIKITDFLDQSSDASGSVTGLPCKDICLFIMISHSARFDRLQLKPIRS